MPATPKPLARKNDLLVQDAQNELVVYDTKTDKAYVLNPSAAAVWRACNGKRSVQEIAHYLNQTTPTDEQSVYYALGQLNDLLEQPTALPREFAGMSRRQFLKRAGIVATAAAIPVVVKIVAPTPAHAQTPVLVCCVCNGNQPPGNWYADCGTCFAVCGSSGGYSYCNSVGGIQCDAL